jgi:hypothetical protein
MRDVRGGFPAFSVFFRDVQSPRGEKDHQGGSEEHAFGSLCRVRTEGDWKADKFKIKGAVREDPNQVKSWMSKYGKDKTLVFYCA